MTETLPFWFFLIALAYSVVGFAGGSSYLLVLTLAGLSHMQSAPVALVCNLVVSSLGVWNFYRAGHLKWSLVLPFMVLSIPMAFVGSMFQVSKKVWLVLLGISLALAGLRLLLSKIEFESSRVSTQRLWKTGLPAGAAMGFFSGMIGLGGGIFLSPFLILTRLATIKQASAAASVFIFVNSLSGLIGKIQHGAVFPDFLPMLVLSALCGGWIGSRLGSGRVPQYGMQRILAALLLYISVNLLLKAF